MEENPDDLALRIYFEAADLREKKRSDEEILAYLTASTLDHESAQKVIDSLEDFMISPLYKNGGD